MWTRWLLFGQILYTTYFKYYIIFSYSLFYPDFFPLFFLWTFFPESSSFLCKNNRAKLPVHLLSNLQRINVGFELAASVPFVSSRLGLQICSSTTSLCNGSRLLCLSVILPLPRVGRPAWAPFSTMKTVVYCCVKLPWMKSTKLLNR